MTSRIHVARHVQSIVPPQVHKALSALSYDLGRSIGELVLDGVLLVLRHHDRGAGLPEPQRPLSLLARAR